MTVLCVSTMVSTHTTQITVHVQLKYHFSAHSPSRTAIGIGSVAADAGHVQVWGTPGPVITLAASRNAGQQSMD